MRTSTLWLLARPSTAAGRTRGRLVAAGTAVAGVELSTADETERARLRRRSVGLVLQFGQLVPDLTVVDNVALPLLLDGHAPDQARAAAAGWLERVGLDVPDRTVPAELSGGQAQLAAAARALVAGPVLLLADEPTASLDSQTGTDVLNLFRDLARQQDRALLIVSHDPKVRTVADRVVTMSDGRLVDETLSELSLKRPAA